MPIKSKAQRRTGLPLGMILVLWHATVAGAQTLVLEGGRYLDPASGEYRPNTAILIRDGRIVRVVAPAEPWSPPAGAQVVALTGRTILPGIIDAHVHLTLGGDPRRNAEATLRAGFTTVLDLGSGNGAGVALRARVASGEAAGPRILAAGSWIGIKGGVCEFGGATVTTPEEARTRAHADKAAGADALKVCVTGWPAEALAAPDSVQLKAPMLAAVRDVARETATPMFAHAIGQAGALLAAEAGVRALAHTPIVDSAAAARLAASGIYVISTLATLGAGPAREPLLRSFRLLHRAGVPIVAGTDAGVLPHGENARELEALGDAGLSPLEAIRAATVTAARLVGDARLGLIAVDAIADFVVVEGDPLTDLTALRKPVMVIRGGRVVPPPP
jgi:imidazolonepropionase-like amidohydrolase